MIHEMLHTGSSRRDYGCAASRSFFLGDGRQSAVDGLGRSRCRGGCGDGGRYGEKTSAPLVRCGFCIRGFCAFAVFAAEGVADGSLMAFTDAVQACHATRIIYCVLLCVDTCRLAVAGAESAAVTFRGVDDRAQQREARDKTQNGAYGADRVTVCASVAPRQYRQHGECYNGHSEGNTPL